MHMSMSAPCRWAALWALSCPICTCVVCVCVCDTQFFQIMVNLRGSITTSYH